MNDKILSNHTPSGVRISSDIFRRGRRNPGGGRSHRCHHLRLSPIFFALLVMAGTSLLAGCTTIEGEASQKAHYTPKRYAMLDPKLREVIRVERVDIWRDAYNKLRVRAAVRNISNKDFTMQGQAIFLLPDGETDIAAWKALPATAGELVFYECVAFSSRAADAVVQLRLMERDKDPFDGVKTGKIHRRDWR